MTLLADAVAAWPATADDGGDGLTGTEVDVAFIAEMEDCINELIHSTTNTAVTPEDIIDEVVSARGGLLDLDTRLDVALNNDGTLKTQAGLVAVADLALSQQKNLMPDALLNMWPGGVAVAPWGWTLAGGGAAVALEDTTIMDWGTYSARITRAGADATLTRTLIAAADFPDGMQGKEITVAMRCICATPNTASLVVDDGVGTTRGGETGDGTSHSGDGNEHWIYCTHVLDAAATELDIYMEVRDNNVAAYFGAIVVCLGKFTPTVWLPDRWGIMPVPIVIRGAAAADTPINDFELPMPVACMLNQTMMHCQTVPNGSDYIIQPQKATVAVYATDPEIPDGTDTNLTAGEGEAADGATQDLRCFNKGDLLEVDCTDDGTADTADVMIQILFDVPLGDLDVLRV